MCKYRFQKELNLLSCFSIIYTKIWVTDLPWFLTSLVQPYKYHFDTFHSYDSTHQSKNQQVCIEPPPSLSTWCYPHLLLSAGTRNYQLISPQQQTRQLPLLLLINGTDRWMADTRQLHSSYCAYYAGSVKTAAKLPILRSTSKFMKTTHIFSS